MISELCDDFAKSDFVEHSLQKDNVISQNPSRRNAFLHFDFLRFVIPDDVHLLFKVFGNLLDFSVKGLIGLVHHLAN